MSAYNPSDASSVERLIARLDTCSGMLDERSAERAQSLIYAGFLSDLVAGRLDVTDPEIDDMVQLVANFCELVEGEFRSSTSN